MDEPWADLSAAQRGMLSRQQLNSLGIDSDRVRNQLRAGRWSQRSSTVLSTFTGTPTFEQRLWLGVLHAGKDSLIGDLTAAQVHGLKNWQRDDVCVLVEDDDSKLEPVPGIRFRRTRRPLPLLRARSTTLPLCRIEPAVLHFAAYEPSVRTAQGVLAAVVQQQLTSPEQIVQCIHEMRPLRRAKLFRRVMSEIGGGAHSLAELDLGRLCRRFGLPKPVRQRKRRDGSGRLRFTDCEWVLPHGQVLVLEIDGSFHMSTEHWEDDLARQRALTKSGRMIVRCSARELRDTPELVARDLVALGLTSRGGQHAV